MASYGRALLHVPEALKTAPMCLAAATQDGEALRWVPEALLSAELFAEAVRQLGEAPIPVPKRLQSALQSIGPAVTACGLPICGISLIFKCYFYHILNSQHTQVCF